MVTDIALLSVLRQLELSAADATVRFRDGEAYIVRVISTMHADEGGDIVAEVVQSLAARLNGNILVGAFMNFLLADVVQVIENGACVFAITSDP